MASFTLVHSPLVGPFTWSFVRDELGRRGHRVEVPTLVAAAETGRWQACVETARLSACTGDAAHTLVGHSGAGPLLPLIATQLDPAPRLVFVDAGVPPTHGDAALLPEDLLARLRTIAVDGRLPKWSEWFGPEAIEQLVPDARVRDAVVAELPRLPVRYFESCVPMPSGWNDLDCSYVLLSEVYRADATEAAARGWPTVELPGGHLDILARPVDIVDVLDAR
jgi:hypothetical protein